MVTNFVSVKEEDNDVRPTPTIRRDYRHLYRKGEMGELECLGCGVQYNSIHGLHCHLNATAVALVRKSAREEQRIVTQGCTGRRASHVLSVLAVNLHIAQCMASTTISIEPDV